MEDRILEINLTVRLKHLHGDLDGMASAILLSHTYHETSESKLAYLTATHMTVFGLYPMSKIKKQQFLLPSWQITPLCITTPTNPHKKLITHKAQLQYIAKTSALKHNLRS